jgi:pimeloyl-ACP methyl ester carboxylesterase
MAAFATAYAWIRARSLGEEGSDEVLHALTDDGFRIALSRYLPRTDRRRRAHPVVLCPGLAANRRTYDPSPDRSLARWLAAMGWDVFVLELRGHGRSERPWPVTKPRRWTLDEHLEHDVPAAIARIREATRAPAVHFIGHSMGGILLYAHAARAERTVRSGIAVASSLDYAGTTSWFGPTTRLRGVARLLPGLPVGVAFALSSPLALRPPSRLDELNVWAANVDADLWRRMAATCFHTVSTGVLAQLATAFDPGGLTSRDGTRHLEMLARADVPLLAIAGTADRQCPPAAAENTARAFRHEASRLELFGRAHGHAEDYGHFDLLVGKNAPTEVWPTIARWLEERD